MFSSKSFSPKSFSRKSWYMGVWGVVVRALRGVSVRVGVAAASFRPAVTETYTRLRETSVRFTMKRKH